MASEEPFVEETDETVIEEEQEVFLPKARWGIPQKVDSTTFVGREVVAVGVDVYIFFVNLKNFTETVYLANSYEKGDGVDCIAGHRTNVFAFAEKNSNPRVFICNYPSFTQITQLQDPEVNRYKSLCMAEGDLIIGFSGFPNYVITVWSWRINQKLVTVPTGVVRRVQTCLASKTHNQICESYGDGLIVWEVAQCYRQTLLMKRVKQANEDDIKIHDVCWTAEGYLYAIDKKARLHSVNSDGIGMVLKEEWFAKYPSAHYPLICGFGSGILMYCPDGKLRWLKVVDSSWQIIWMHHLINEVLKLISNSTFDVAVMWTEKGHLYRIVGEGEDKLEMCLVAYKQRNILKMQIIAPDCNYVATINSKNEICLYDVLTAKLVKLISSCASDSQIQASPVDPVLALYGEVGINYGVTLLSVPEFKRIGTACVTDQIMSRVCFSPTGKELCAAAMSIGHIFIYKIHEDYTLELIRFAEIGRGLADCFFAQVGQFMRLFSLVIFSDKYKIGEKIVCINAVTGKDNKFAGKMQGPYRKLFALMEPDTVVAIPHLSRQFHILKLSGEKGVTVQVRVERVIDSGHEMKCFTGLCNIGGVLTYGVGGRLVLRGPTVQGDYQNDMIYVTSHRYEAGVKYACLDIKRRYVLSLGHNNTFSVSYLNENFPQIQANVQHEPIEELFMTDICRVKIHETYDKNWHDLQEDKKVKEETIDYRSQREEVVKTFLEIQKSLVALLEENLEVIPMHQLPVSEFNLHLEAKRERLKQAADERDMIRATTEAKIIAQDRVTEWIKQQCWDTMLTPRVKIFAIFSHYVVENYAVLPTQRENWPELQQMEHLRMLEIENDEHSFKPWIERNAGSPMEVVSKALLKSTTSLKSVGTTLSVQLTANVSSSSEENVLPVSHVLSGTLAHNFINIPHFNIHQLFMFSFLQMHFAEEQTKS